MASGKIARQRTLYMILLTKKNKKFTYSKTYMCSIFRFIERLRYGRPQHFVEKVVTLRSKRNYLKANTKLPD